jgi:membrane protease YdiL (CAAX protease family)
MKPLVIGVALFVFVARPFVPSPALFGALLVVGIAWPTVAARRLSFAAVAGPFLIGVACLAVGRLFGHAPGFPLRPGYVALVVVAAVAEEAFFRRLVYATLEPGGAALATLGSAALFAAAHVTVYGFWVLPLDLAAGLVLSWQRWATGTWTVPAATHVVANLMVVL